MGSRLRVVVLALGALIAVLAVAMPVPSTLTRAGPTLVGAIDSSLRVPYGSVLLNQPDRNLRPGDRVLRVHLSDGVVSPVNSESLQRIISAGDGGEDVRLEVDRDGSRIDLPVPVVVNTPLERVADNWPVVLVGACFLLFGFTVLVGSRHPVAAPIFLVSLFSGTGFLCSLDGLLPDDPGLFGWPSARARTGLLALTLIPAALLHFAMRFPVVGQPFRASTFPLLAYLFWLVPAFFGQVRFHDSVFINSLERISLGACLLSAALLIITSLIHDRSMSVIERSRSRALLFGFGIGGGLLLVLYASGGVPSASHHGVVLGVLALPISLGWAIVRYRLLDPSRWFADLLLHGIAGAAALSLVALVLTTGGKLFTGRQSWTSSETIGVAVIAMVLTAFLHFLLHRILRSRMGPRRALERFMDEAVHQLGRSGHPDGLRREVCELIRRHFGASAVECVVLPPEGRPGSSLLAGGLRLWEAHGAPRQRIVAVGARTEDPGSDQPEVVVPLHPQGTAPALLVVGSRDDALPYGREQVAMLETLGRLATIALGNAATTAELEARVDEKTASLERSLAERSRVLEAAYAICEADSADEVRHLVDAFAESCATEDGGTRGGPVASTSGSAGSFRNDRSEPSERHPQLETVRIFGDLAIARLDLVGQLKREVELQAAEIAEISSRRLNAEFVRNVAHELRKPTEEIECLANALSPSAGDVVARLRRASREMCRRLDLLLFHSGLHLNRHRIDLRRIIDDAVDRARAVHPDCLYSVRHAEKRLPLIGDSSRLLSVVENIVDNAVKAMGEGGRVQIRSWLETDIGLGDSRRWVCLEVEDEGSGVPLEHVEQIFESGVSFTEGGFGLGLALCQEIVRRQSGHIELESEPGCTVFRVRLPQFAVAPPGEATA